ncbi:DedA family protein [Ferrovibrio sp.]|uniref:DedA family protein n=1 Tax=Ferrovibrio sp. TaxID=1917215 RepID=UPI0035B2B676
MNIDINQLIAEYRDWFYIITFVWAFLEGETFVIFAGAAASQGHLHMYWLIGAAWLGSFMGDQLYFWIGRRWGHKLLKRFPKLQGGVNVALDMLHKYHVGFILSFRFIYGVRNFSSLAMGMSPIGWPRFAGLNLIAAGLWANSFAWAGYLLGVAFEAVLGDIAKDFGLVMLTVFVVVGIILFIVHRRSKANFDRRVAESLAEHKQDATSPEAAPTAIPGPDKPAP